MKKIYLCEDGLLRRNSDGSLGKILELKLHIFLILVIPQANSRSTSISYHLLKLFLCIESNLLLRALRKGAVVMKQDKISGILLIESFLL